MSQIWISNRRLHKQNRRQQKKLKMGEFRELIFEIELNFQPALDELAFTTMQDEFVAFIEAANLCLWGMSETAPVEHAYGLIATPGHGAATAEDRSTVLSWLQRRTEITAIHVGELVDAHYVLL